MSFSVSRYTPNKKNPFKNNFTSWIAGGYVYKVTTDQGEIIHRCQNKLDYKETLRRFYKAGYTNVNITLLGRDVTF